MDPLARSIVRRFRARTQLDDLADKASRAARALYNPRISVNELAKNTVSMLIREDRDGSTMGAVYNDSFNRQQFLRTLTAKLRGLDVNHPKIAEAILLELEDRK